MKIKKIGGNILLVYYFKELETEIEFSCCENE